VGSALGLALNLAGLAGGLALEFLGLALELIGLADDVVPTGDLVGGLLDLFRRGGWEAVSVFREIKTL
jgi:hypothetical protein